MIWKILFKDDKSKIVFEKKMKSDFVYCKEMHDHNINEEEFYGDFIYDMGYLGYAEAEELKPELKKLGVIELRQICLCDIDGEKIISPKP